MLMIFFELRLGVYAAAAMSLFIIIIIGLGGCFGGSEKVGG